LILAKERIPTVDKIASRRDEVLKEVEDQMRMSMQRREGLSKELAELDHSRNDLKATMDILEHQFQGLQQVMERANAPKVEVVDYDVPQFNKAVNGATTARKW
jgi:chromosome segregation ATPase